MNKKTLIQSLQLEPHIEGGYFRRSYSAATFSLPASHQQQRPLLTAIYYMLTDDSPVAFFHRNQSDILHFWHRGSALQYLLIDLQGNFQRITLGPNLDQGEHLQLLVPGGYWKATELLEGTYGLLSEAVSPGFDYDDMQLANPELLQQAFPTVWTEQQLGKYCMPPAK